MYTTFFDCSTYIYVCMGWQMKVTEHIGFSYRWATETDLRGSFEL